MKDYEPTDKEVMNMLPVLTSKKMTKVQIKKMFDFAKSFLIEKNKKKIS